MPIDKEALRKPPYSQTQSRSQQSPQTEATAPVQDLSLNPELALAKLQNNAQEIASGLRAARKNHAAHNILRRTEEFTSDVDRISKFYQIIGDPEVVELVAFIDAARKISAKRSKPVQINVVVPVAIPDPLAGFLGSGDVSFSRFYQASESEQSLQQQLASSTLHNTFQEQV